MRKTNALIIGAWMILAAHTSLAHHSSAPHYDNTKPVVVEGVVTKFRFVNPHAYVYVDVTDDDGNVVNWNCELVAASALKRKGWTKELLAPGTSVRIDGIMARRDPHGCALQTAVLADGTTLARYGVIGAADPAASSAKVDLASMSGTWQTDPERRTPPRRMDHYTPLLTEAGKAATEGYDDRFDDPALNCSPSSILRAWGEPNGLSRIEQTPDEIVIRHEYMDTVRVIDMTTREHPANPERSLTGHSVGWFEGETLVIETVGFEAGVLLPHPGILHTEDMRVIERVELAGDGTRLVQTYEVHDPKFLTGPVTGNKNWVRSTDALGQYDCTELGGINKVRPASSE